MNFAHRFAELEQRKAQQLYRKVRINEVATGRYCQVDGLRYLNFSSNDYLGLAGHPDVINAYCQGAREFGVGSGGSPLVTGFQRPHAHLSEQLQDWLGYPAVMLLSSGFAANQMVIKTLLGKDDLLLQDKLNHASLIDAGLCSGALFRRFLHNQPQSLERYLSEAVQRGRLVVTEGVFSMDGDQAPLQSISALCSAHQAWLMVDDAHGIGVLGPQGQGSCAQQGLKAQLLMATFGKALGVGGAMVAASTELIELLTNFGRDYIYSTAMPAAQAVAVSEAIRQLQTGVQREQLQQHITTFKTLMTQTSWTLMPSDTAIQPLLVGDAGRALRLAQALREQGFWVSAMRPPTVPAGQSRLRITLSASHQIDDLQRLVEALITLESRSWDEC